MKSLLFLKGDVLLISKLSVPLFGYAAHREAVPSWEKVRNRSLDSSSGDLRVVRFGGQALAADDVFAAA